MGLEIRYHLLLTIKPWISWFQGSNGENISKACLTRQWSTIKIQKGAFKQAVLMKYQNVLSRRKYALVCKTQSSVFDPNSELWVPHNMKCLGLDLRVPWITISDKQVENFVRNLDIGHVNQIPNAPGVSRTITGLVFMIIDLHLRLPHLSHKLIWFNENTNHFLFQFSDDGAPESSQLCQ